MRERSRFKPDLFLFGGERQGSSLMTRILSLNLRKVKLRTFLDYGFLRRKETKAKTMFHRASSSDRRERWDFGYHGRGSVRIR